MAIALDLTPEYFALAHFAFGIIDLLNILTPLTFWPLNILPLETHNKTHSPKNVWIASLNEFNNIM